MASVRVQIGFKASYTVVIVILDKITRLVLPVSQNDCRLMRILKNAFLFVNPNLSVTSLDILSNVLPNSLLHIFRERCNIALAHCSVDELL